MNTAKSEPSRLREAYRSRVLRRGMAIAVLGAGVAAWSLYLNAAPKVAMPLSAPLPVPNAYDELQTLGQKHVQIPESIWYTPSSNLVSAKTSLRVFSDVQRQSILVKAEPTLAALRTALRTHAYRDVTPNDIELEDSGMDRLQGLCNLLNFEARMRERAGDNAGAVQSDLDAIWFGSIVASGGCLKGHDTGVGMEVEPRRRIWPLVNRLNAAQATDAARRLESIEANRRPLFDSVFEQKWALVAETQRVLEHDATFGPFAHFDIKKLKNAYSELDLVAMLRGNRRYSDINDESPQQRQVDLHRMFRIWWEMSTVSKQTVLDRTMAILDDWIAQSRQRWNAPRPKTAMPGLTNDPLSHMTLGPEDVLHPAMFEDTKARMLDGLLELNLALRAYRVQSGDYPANLDRLVQAGIIHSVPEDPFQAAAGVPMRYRRVDANHFVLYSVGPDGVDDGGRPFLAFESDGNARISLFATDKGDWVVGENSVGATQGEEN